MEHQNTEHKKHKIIFNPELISMTITVSVSKHILVGHRGKIFIKCVAFKSPRRELHLSKEATL